MRESKDFSANYLTKFSIDLNELGELLRLVGVMNLTLILFHPLIIKEREAYILNFV